MKIHNRSNSLLKTGLWALMLSLLTMPVMAGPLILDWDANPTADGVTTYRLFQSTKTFLTATPLTTAQVMADSTITKINISAPTLTATLSTLALNTTYYFRLVAVDAAGNVSAMNVDGSGNPAQVSTFTGAGLNTPVLVTINPVTCFRTVVNWQANNPSASSVKLQRSVGTGGFSDHATLPASTTHYVDVNLSSGTVYNYRVAALTSGGAVSPFSNVKSTTTRKIGDIDGAGGTDVTDLSMLLFFWDTANFQCNLNGGISGGDNIVDVTDLSMLLYNWDY